MRAVDRRPAHPVSFRSLEEDRPINARSGQTFVETLKLAQTSGSQIVQIATWNDYGEGTVVEPTSALGYRYLEHIQQSARAGQPYDASDLRLKVVISWLFVGIPLLIGVVQTILKSLELFR